MLKDVLTWTIVKLDEINWKWENHRNCEPRSISGAPIAIWLCLPWGCLSPALSFHFPYGKWIHLGVYTILRQVPHLLLCHGDQLLRRTEKWSPVVQPLPGATRSPKGKSCWEPLVPYPGKVHIWCSRQIWFWLGCFSCVVLNMVEHCWTIPLTHIDPGKRQGTSNVSYSMEAGRLGAGKGSQGFPEASDSQTVREAYLDNLQQIYIYMYIYI